MQDVSTGPDDRAAWLGALPGGVSAVVSWRRADGGIRIASSGSDQTIRIWDPERTNR